MKKSYLAEGYRFAVAISIVMFHFLKTGPSKNNMRMGVEFFFILSGFLLMAHLEKHPDESIPHLMMGKLRNLYPGMFVLFCMADIAVVLLEKKKTLFVVAYQHLSQLMLVTNAFNGKAKWLSGTYQLWYVLSLLWATLILAWLIKMHRKSYESALGILIALGCYTICIRCSGNLNNTFDWTIGDYKIYLPLSLLRALAGMICGTMTYLVYKKLSLYTYTNFAKVGGTAISIFCFSAGLWLTTQSSKKPINSYGWCTLIVVALYAVAVTFAFAFAKDFPSNKAGQKALALSGSFSMPIYMTHVLTLYIMKKVMDVSERNAKCLLFLLVVTAVLSFIYEVCVHLLRKGWGSVAAWMKSVCIVSANE